jgi:hypothetical protein
VVLHGQRKTGRDSLIEFRREVDLRLTQAINKFGLDNTLVTHLLELQVLALLELSEYNEAELTDSIGRLATQLFGIPKVSTIDVVTEPTRHFRLLNFSRSDYDQHYSDITEWSDYEISNSFNDFRGKSNIFDKFIFVIGPSDEWRHYTRPQPVETSLAGRRNPRLFPFHPFLSREFDFQVRVAGEVSVSWDKYSSFPAVMYVNNVSGHYKPSDVKAQELLDIVASQFTNFSATTFLSICNDGACVYRRKKSP